ncbi:hypothetical protein B7P43_G14103 [Cryptotermes secundus]|uniref:PiggyBac transposable element-derived protein domain-containing protein n=1 Tax=Cryptotermes secundus TaxID=105785 RepID=A0A2J7PFV6_9NEOP|nr:hypothetical protein B7P43_G14103 [Cryptotermes secundus]
MKASLVEEKPAPVDTKPAAAKQEEVATVIPVVEPEEETTDTREEMEARLQEEKEPTLVDRKPEDSGRCVYMDNFYSSPDLFQRLVQRTTDAVGTVKITRKGMPIDLKKKLKKGVQSVGNLNAYILYCKAGNKKDHLLFRINLVNKIIAKSHGQNLEKRKGSPSDTDMECTRLTGQHFIQENPKTETYKGGRGCVVSTQNGKRKETRYRCKNCGYLKAEVFKHHPTNLLQLKNVIRQEVAQIPVHKLEPAEGNFRKRLHQCIENGGHHLQDILFKTT